MLLLTERQRDYQNWLRKLEQQYPKYYELKYAPTKPIELADFQGKLKRNQVALEYFWGVDSLYIFAIDANDMQVTTRPLNNGLADTVKLYYELLSSGVGPECEQQFLQLSHMLYQQLLPPALPASTKRLLIIPDGLVHLINFETLLTQPRTTLNGAEGFLLEQYAISYLPSSSALLAPKRSRRKYSGQFLGVGLEYDDVTLNYLAEEGVGNKVDVTTPLLPCQDSTRSRKLGKLIYSDDEVRRIAERIGGVVRLNADATKQSFLQQASGQDILHLAMHGTYDLRYPLNSALLFSYDQEEDLALRAAEIYGLELDANMVVLSACNTAYGQLAEGEGTMSLARAFNYAGATSTVASLWTAVDYSTAEIMVLFYDHLLAGMPKDEALRQAKLDFLNSSSLSSPSTRRPYHWASTIVIGDIEPLKTPIAWYWWGIGIVGLLLGLLFVLHRRLA